MDINLLFSKKIKESRIIWRFSAYSGGNTVSCTVGLTVREVVLEENLQENALKGGKCLLEGMTLFIEPYRIAGNARGAQIFHGVEQECGRETL